MPTVSVRLATPADGPAVAGVYQPYVVATAITFDETPTTADEFAARISQARRTLPFYVAEDAGGVVGFAVATPHGARASFRWSVNLMIYIAAESARRGVGRALYGRMLPDLRGMNYVRAYAGITLPNAASIGLHESLGFRHVATFPAAGFKLGTWHDVGWWERRLIDPLPARPLEPAAFPDGP